MGGGICLLQVEGGHWPPEGEGCQQPMGGGKINPSTCVANIEFGNAGEVEFNTKTSLLMIMSSSI